jgi:hypothetical protein
MRLNVARCRGELSFEVLEHVNASGDLSHQRAGRLHGQMTTTAAGERPAWITGAGRSIARYPSVGLSGSEEGTRLVRLLERERLEGVKVIAGSL